MSDTTIIIIVAVLAFLILTLVLSFRSKSFKNTLEAPGGVKFTVEAESKEQGSKDKQTETSTGQPAPNAAAAQIVEEQGGQASITIKGKAEHSTLIASGEEKGQAKVGSDLLDSHVQVKGRSADVKVGGDAIGSDVKAENPSRPKKTD